MATVDGQTETASLGSYAKKHVRYGSMAKENSMRRERDIKHSVQPGDTLQGLALRYGVTMEQIKRANKMWTTDSLFLRSTLDIPIFSGALNVSSMASAPQSPQTSPVKQRSDSIDANDGNSSIMPNNLSSQLTASVIDEDTEINLRKEESAADFLIRIDSHIAQTKDKVLKLQKHVVNNEISNPILNGKNYSEDDLHNCRQGLPQMGSEYHKNNLTASSSLGDLTGDISVPPQPVVMTQGRKVRSSLRKLEREQDEIFEL